MEPMIITSHMPCPHCGDRVRVIQATWHYKTKCRVLLSKVNNTHNNGRTSS